MGLDTTHNAWHGPYSSFNRFRKSLMKAYNQTNLDDYDGYGGDIPLASIQDKGLFVFFNHSDCDGDISPDDCKLVSESITELISRLDNTGFWSDAEKATQFAKGCMDAYKLGETLEFH